MRTFFDADGSIVIHDPNCPEAGVLRLSHDDYERFYELYANPALDGRVTVLVPRCPEKGSHTTTLEQYNSFRLEWFAQRGVVIKEFATDETSAVV